MRSKGTDCRVLAVPTLRVTEDLLHPECLQESIAATVVHTACHPVPTYRYTSGHLRVGQYLLHAAGGSRPGFLRQCAPRGGLGSEGKVLRV